MPTITLKNIPDELHQRLREAAARNHRSLNGEILACLEEHFMPRGTADIEAFLTEVRQLQADMPLIDHTLIDELKREGRP